MPHLSYLLDFVAVLPLWSSHSMVSLWVLALACRSKQTPTKSVPVQPATNLTGRCSNLRGSILFAHRKSYSWKDKLLLGCFFPFRVQFTACYIQMLLDLFLRLLALLHVNFSGCKLWLILCSSLKFL